ncbi:hypothetical protein BG004_005015, partial [Podila humilis]
LADFEKPQLDPDYENQELRMLLISIYPALNSIIAGIEDEGGRLRDFLADGKRRRSLAQRVGPGRFDWQEFTYINSLLQKEYIPEVITTNNTIIGASKAAAMELQDRPMQRDDAVTKHYLPQTRLRFVADVLVPEAITRLTMAMENIGYKEADETIQSADCNTEYWVDEVLAARESFLEGRANS